MNEEQVFDGVLHWRKFPSVEWTPYTAQELTLKLMEARQTYAWHHHLPRYTPTYVPPAYPQWTSPTFPPTQPWPGYPWTITCAAPNAAQPGATSG